MWFNSFLYLAFLPTVLLIYYGLRSWDARKIFLLIASYLFYAAWNPPFVLLLLGSSTLDYFIGLALGNTDDPRRRKLMVALSCTVSLGVLVAFKYSAFFLAVYDSLLTSLGLGAYRLELSPFLAHIVLPVGISFYTFHGISYIVDVYRGTTEVKRRWTDFFLFVSFFPQLVAGPILRANTFMPQLTEPRRATWADWDTGLRLIALGLFQKVALADNIAPLANYIFDDYRQFATGELWIGVYAFALQIYFDFAGYSNIAIGTARLLGFHIPENFNLPYLAIGFRDFWRRWHISLSTWLRDYLYISLGGNRRGELRTSVNLLVVMFLGGLWHGASWSFVVWGVIHGIYLIVEHFLAPLLKRVPSRITGNPVLRFTMMLVTFHGVCLAWVFFRMPRLSDALAMASEMVIPSSFAVDISMRTMAYVFVALGGLLAAAMITRIGRVTPQLNPILRGSLAAGMLFLTMISWGDANEFIYFQF